MSDISHSLVNIMEDVYIESRICDEFAGSFRTGILLNNLRFAEEMNTVQDEVNRQHHEIFIILNLLIQYAKAGDINNLGGYKGPYLNVLYDCIPLIDDAVYDDDAKTRFDAANQLLLLLWPYMKSFIEQIREDLKNDTSQAREDLSTQLAKGIPLPNGTGRGSKADKDPSMLNHEETGEDDEEERARIQKVLDYEEGRMALEKTESINEDGSGGTEYENDFAGSGYVSQAEADMHRIMTQLAEDYVYSQYEEELTEELQQEAVKIRYGNAHQGIHVRVNRMCYVSPEYMEAYQQAAPPLLLLSKRLQKQVSQQLKDYKSGGKLDNLPMGKRINVRNAVHKDGRIFYKMNLPNDRADIAVAVLNDESGSMSSFDRITYARAASIILHDFCKCLEIPIAIYGHTEDYDVELYSYAEFDSLDNKDQYRLMDMSSRSGNRDGAAIRFVAERLLQRREAVKLLFIISDGQPAAEGYFGTEAEADIQGIKQEYTRKGIRFIAAAIGSDKPNIHRIYGDCYLDITNLEKLPINISPEEAKFILSRLTAGFREFNYQQDKIFGEPDPAGYSKASKIRIIRAVKDSKGNARKLPWYIEIENGKGIPQKNSTGGTYMKANSFLSEGKAYTNLSDLDLFRLLSRVSSYIDSWEKAAAPSLIKLAKNTMESRRTDKTAA